MKNFSSGQGEKNIFNQALKWCIEEGICLFNQSDSVSERMLWAVSEVCFVDAFVYRSSPLAEFAFNRRVVLGFFASFMFNRERISCEC